MKNTNDFIWLLVSLNRHKNIIQHCVHISVTHEMVMKTRFRANIIYQTRPNAKKYRALFSLMFSCVIEIHVKCLNNLFGF